MDMLWLITREQLDRLREDLDGARTLRVALDEGTLKWKVNEDGWTAGLDPEHVPTFRSSESTHVCKSCGKRLEPDRTRDGWISEDGEQFCSAYSVGVYEHAPESAGEVVRFYTSADGPGADSPWSVYRERYASADSDEPIDGSEEHISTHPTEADADREARRLRAQSDDEGEDEPEDICQGPDGHWYRITYGRARWEIHANRCPTCEQLYGHCDTCGARCDSEGCTANRSHVAALDVDDPTPQTTVEAMTFGNDHTDQAGLALAGWMLVERSGDPEATRVLAVSLDKEQL